MGDEDKQKCLPRKKKLVKKNYLKLKEDEIMKSREAEAVSLYDHEPEEEIIPFFFFMCD